MEKGLTHIFVKYYSTKLNDSSRYHESSNYYFNSSEWKVMEN
jgi:hypothetical protein